LRKAAGFNIGELARRLRTRGWDVSVKTVSAWERNLVNPPPATINAIAEELAVTSDAILSTAPALAAQTLDGLFTDATIAAFFEEWATEANLPVEAITERSKRLLASAGKRNATSVTPQTLLAVLRHFRTSPAFEVTE
jgi:transcriptional regulator with XRE-family HTH domain